MTRKNQRWLVVLCMFCLASGCATEPRSQTGRVIPADITLPEVWVDPPPAMDSSLSPDITAVIGAPDEHSAWGIAKASRDVAVLDAFLSKYPLGGHQKSAKLRRSLLLKGAIK